MAPTYSRTGRKTSQGLYTAALERRASGDLEQASALCRELLGRERLEGEPAHFQALHLLGVLEHQAGRNAAAAELIAQAIAMHPHEASYHCNLGVVLQALGKPVAAVQAYEYALQLKPDYAEAHFNLANALQVLQRLDASVAHYVQALRLKPDYAVAFMNLGNVVQALGQLKDAEELYGHALRLQPECAEAHMNLGNVLQAQGRLDEAMARYVQAFAFRPGYADAYVNLGNLLQGQGKLAEAAVAYERALGLRADHPEALVNLGTALESMGCHEEAVNRYDAAITLRPDYAEAHVNRALNLLRRGDFAAGFSDYEWRWKMSNLRSPRRDFRQPRWLGEKLCGGRILLHGEQGLGDSIQFLRFIPMVSAAGGSIVLEVPDALRRLVNAFCGAQVISFGDLLPDFDWHCPLMSLPLALGTTVETIPAAPYLSLSAGDVLWSPLGLKVGVVWAGNAEHSQDKLRSIPLAIFASIFELEEIHFYSLQLGREEAALPDKVTDLAPQIHDFADTAAFLMGLDLVISVDTAVAHLAGALGRPIWVLLAHRADWRWMLAREDSPWYPTARLFRQESFGDWNGVIRRVRTELIHYRDAVGIAMQAAGPIGGMQAGPC